jgi:hypothetical protein
MNILHTIHQESGLKFLERVQPRPRLVLKDILPFFELPDDPRPSEKFGKEIVEICGKNNDGKTCKILVQT